MNKEERIQLLVDNEIITESASKFVNEFIELLEKDYKIDWTNETSLMFVTHLGVSINRMLLDEPVEEVPEEVRKEISMEDPLYIWSVDTFDNISKNNGVPLNITEAEVLLITTYLKIITI